MIARITNMNWAYAHAMTEQGDRVFVHKSECDFRLNEAQQGDFIEIGSVEPQENGNFYARDVRWTERPVAQHPPKPSQRRRS